MAYREVSAQQPDNGLAYNNIGAMLMRRKLPNDNVTTVTLPFPFPSFAAANRLVAALQVQAFHAFRDAITVQPNLIQGWDNLAATAQELGARQVAEKAWMQARCFRPHLPLLIWTCSGGKLGDDPGRERPGTEQHREPVHRQQAVRCLRLL